jgi:hypothetical protein
MKGNLRDDGGSASEQALMSMGTGVLNSGYGDAAGHTR